MNRKIDTSATGAAQNIVQSKDGKRCAASNPLDERAMSLCCVFPLDMVDDITHLSECDIATLRLFS